MADTLDAYSCVSNKSSKATANLRKTAVGYDVFGFLLPASLNLLNTHRQIEWHKQGTLHKYWQPQAFSNHP